MRFRTYAAAYATGQALSSAVTARLGDERTRRRYAAFDQPSFAPPGTAFPIVWSTLNVSTAASAARLDAAPATRDRAEALGWWWAAAGVRLLYTPLAFGRLRLGAATVSSAGLALAMARYAQLARRVDPAAAALATPELAWTAFATVLSAEIARRNR